MLDQTQVAETDLRSLGDQADSQRARVHNLGLVHKPAVEQERQIGPFVTDLSHVPLAARALRVALMRHFLVRSNNPEVPRLPGKELVFDLSLAGDPVDLR